MEAEELLYSKIIKRGASWKEIRAEIVKDFMFLNEAQRNELADCWDNLTGTQDFKIRKMNKDRSNDPRIYSSVYDHIQEQNFKRLEKDKKRLQKYINGKPVDFKPKHKK